ncbi:MAG: hypothetical protein J4F29_00500 [Candidatus Latescibacteria bacterium]|nr:hypothetical protein [Candidatus Latescibacterota bacterium]
MTSFHNKGGLRIATLLCFFFFLDRPACANDVRPGYQVVSRAEIVEAMRQCGDYDPTATTNGARFQGDMILYLAQKARARDPQGLPLFIGYENWFQAFMEVTARTEDAMPQYARLSYQYKQITEVDYRVDRVIREIVKAPTPELAVNVRVWWKDQPGKPDRYSYLDTLSTPNLKVTNQRVMTYRLLDFGDWVIYDEIEGLTGRPTSGILGFLFRIIGEGRIVQTRMAISKDGFQINRATAKKGFIKRIDTVTVYPDGKMEKDVPPGRPDLLELTNLITQPLEIEYAKLSGDR